MIYVLKITWMPGESATFLHPSWIGLQAGGVCLDMLMCEPDTNTVSQLEADSKVTSCSLLDWNIRRHSPHLHVVLRRPWGKTCQKTAEEQIVAPVQGKVPEEHLDALAPAFSSYRPDCQTCTQASCLGRFQRLCACSNTWREMEIKSMCLLS